MTGRRRVRVPSLARRHALALSCVSGAVVVFLVGLIVIMTMPLTYRATAVLAVRSAPGTTVSTDTLRLLAHEYAIRITSSESLHATATNFQTDLRDLRSMTEVSTDADATVIRVAVTDSDALTAVGMSNHLAQSGVEQSVNDEDVSVYMISTAQPDNVEIGPPRRTYIALLLGVSITLAAALWYLLNGRRSGSSALGTDSRRPADQLIEAENP